MSVCLSVRSRIHDQTSLYCLRVLPVAVGRSSFDDNAIGYGMVWYGMVWQMSIYYYYYYYYYLFIMHKSSTKQ